METFNVKVHGKNYRVTTNGRKMLIKPPDGRQIDATYDGGYVSADSATLDEEVLDMIQKRLEG